MHIDWDSLSVHEWYNIYRQLPKSNLVQTYAYAKTMRQIHFQNTRFGAIKNTGGDILGLVQMQTVSFWGLKRAFIDRGPLWINPENFNHTRQFWEIINRAYPRRLLTKRRFLPEVEKTQYTENLFEQLGFVKKGDGYKTIWLDLAPSLETLEKNLNKKWRNTLRQSQRADLSITIDPHSSKIDQLIKNYMQDRLQKKYAGASPKFILAMERHKSADERSFIITAKTNQNDPCAMMYFWIHGTSATYQIGWTNEQGRATSAHYAMMWHAIEYLKSNGIKWLDLGGINPDTASGVTRFKSGLGGQTFESPGLYC